MLAASFLTFLDIFVSCFVLSPIVIAYWLVTWEFMERNTKYFPLWWTMVISWILQVVATYVRHNLYDVNAQFTGWKHKFFSRIYIYVLSVIGIAGWWSQWDLCERHFDTKSTAIALAVSLVPFALFNGCVNNLLSIPYSVGVDHHRAGLYNYATAFNVNSNENIGWYILDCVFSVCVVGTLVVFVWRGHWTLLEIYLYPGQPGKSALASVVIGYALVIVTFLLQPVMKYLARTLTGIVRLLVVDIYLLISFSGTINVWRGIWNFLNYYFLTNLPLLSFFITHSLCFLFLVLINSSNSILVRGVYIDGQEAGEQCVDFPCYYIRLFFQEKRKKKIMKSAEQRRLSHKPVESETLLTGSKTPEIVSNHSTPNNPSSV